MARLDKLPDAPPANSPEPQIPADLMQNFGDHLKDGLREGALKALGMPADEPKAPEPPKIPAEPEKPSVEPAKPIAAPTEEPKKAEPEVPVAKPEAVKPVAPKAEPPTLASIKRQLADRITPPPAPRAEGEYTLEQATKDADSLLENPNLPKTTDKALRRFRQEVRDKTEALTKAEAEWQKRLLAAEEAAKSRPAMTDEQQKLVENAKMLQRKLDLENDPEVKSKFDDPIVDNNKKIAARLVEYAGFSAEDAAKIEKYGYDAILRTSEGVIKQAFDDKQVPGWVQREIDMRATNILSLKDQRGAFFSAETQRADQYFKEKQEREATQQQQSQQQEVAYRQNAKKWVGEAVNQHPLLIPIQIPSDATPEQRSSMQEAEVSRQQMVAMMERSLVDRDPAPISELWVEHLNNLAQTHQLLQRMRDIEGERDEWKTKFEGLTGATPGAPKQQAGPRDPPPPPKNNGNLNFDPLKAGYGMFDTDSMRESAQRLLAEAANR